MIGLVITPVDEVMRDWSPTSTFIGEAILIERLQTERWGSL